MELLSRSECMFKITPGRAPHSLRSWANPGGPMPPSTGARAHGQMILKTASGEQETEADLLIRGAAYGSEP